MGEGGGGRKRETSSRARLKSCPFAGSDVHESSEKQG